MTAAIRWLGRKTRGLAFKTTIALAAAALPALAVAFMLGTTLIDVAGEAERDFERAISASRRLANVRQLIEKEHGLVTRIPAELNLDRVDAFAGQISEANARIDPELAALGASDRVVSAALASEIAATRAAIQSTTSQIVDAAKSFSQTTASDLVNGPYEANVVVLHSLLAAIESQVHGIIAHARTHLQSSTQTARWLVPIALAGALAAVGLGILAIRRNFIAPVMQLTDHVARIRASGNLEVPEVPELSRRQDEIGILDQSFVEMVRELAEARRRLIASSQAELQTQYERLNAAIDNMPQGLCMYDADQNLIISNRFYAEIYGIDPALLVPGTPLRTVLQERAKRTPAILDAEDWVETRLAAVRARESWYVVTDLPDGRSIAVTHRPMPDGGSIATHEDITERRRAEERIAYLAHHDALTDLPNRVRFREDLDAALGRVDHGDELAIFCLDLDHFKAVNDTLGHPIGDALLQAVAKRIRRTIGRGDCIARLGGDEFAIVQVPTGEPRGCIPLAERLIETISRPYEIHGHQVVIGASIGIAMAPSDGDDSDSLLKHADMALYRAKEDGRSTYRFFEPEMDVRMQARRALELDLRKALALNEFELFYQPVVSLQTGRVSAFEALLRWRHPLRGLVMPGEFVPLAEEIGLIGPIGAWVLKTACKEAMNWPKSIRIAVNLSPVQFKGGTIALDVVAALGASGLRAERLELEITEAVLLQDTEVTLSTLNQLKDLGVRISMDDFGTGYSSLGYLQKFPFDKIKIDKSFVRDLFNTQEAIAIVRAVTSLSNSLGVSTTAEGVESESQLEQLRNEGCTEVQGYLFSQPKPAHEIDLLLERLMPDQNAGLRAAG